MILIRPEDVQLETGEGYHGGTGPFTRRTLFEDIEDSVVKYTRDIVIPAGTMIAPHSHAHEEEIFYFISGTGSVTVDGEKQKVTSGCIVLTLPGGVHAVTNDGESDLRFLAVCIKHS